MRLLTAAKCFLAVLCVSALAAHADTITTFGLSGSFYVHTQQFDGGPYSASGQITINTTRGTVEFVNFDQPQAAGFYEVTEPVAQTFIFNDPSVLPYVFIYEQWADPQTSSNRAGLGIFLDTSTLLGYTGGNICSLSNICEIANTPYGFVSAGNFDNSAFAFNEGSLYAISSVETSPTPEPSSLALLGTGMLGLIGVVRRRMCL